LQLIWSLILLCTGADPPPPACLAGHSLDLRDLNSAVLHPSGLYFLISSYWLPDWCHHFMSNSLYLQRLAFWLNLIFLLTSRPKGVTNESAFSTSQLCLALLWGLIIIYFSILGALIIIYFSILGGVDYHLFLHLGDVDYHLLGLLVGPDPPLLLLLDPEWV
jgi:hypothetical protein